MKQSESINSDNFEDFQSSLYENYGEDVKYKTLGVVGSNFYGFDNKIIIDNNGKKLKCKFSKSWDDVITFSLESEDNKIKSYIKFVDFGGYYSLDNVESFERGYGSLILDFFLESIGDDGVYLTDNASLKGSDDGIGNEIKLTDFYEKRGFRNAKNKTLNEYGVKVIGNIIEDEILENWF